MHLPLRAVCNTVPVPCRFGRYKSAGCCNCVQQKPFNPFTAVTVAAVKQQQRSSDSFLPNTYVPSTMSGTRGPPFWKQYSSAARPCSVELFVVFRRSVATWNETWNETWNMTNQMKAPQQRDVCQHTFYSIEHGNSRAPSRKVVSSIMLFLKIMCAEEGEGVQWGFIANRWPLT